MTSPILVTGGTGTLGRLVVRRLGDAGYKVRVLSRRCHEAGTEFMTGDLATGQGIEPAVDGVETIVHCAGSNKGDEDKTRNLVRAASSQMRLPHLVYISVVGAERIPIDSRVDRMFGYFASKRAAEKVVEDRTADDAARDPVSRGYADGGAADAEAAGATGPGWVPFPTGRGGRGGGPARRAHARRADRQGARHGWAAGVRRGRAAARLPSGHQAAAADRAGVAAGQGRPRVPLAPTWPSSRPWDTGPGRSSWPRS